jgi:hypothetical protein
VIGPLRDNLEGHTYFPRLAVTVLPVSLWLMRGVAASPMPIADVFPPSDPCERTSAKFAMPRIVIGAWPSIKS